jgi:hypothetical protein
MDTPLPTGAELRRLYDQGTNIMAYLRRVSGVEHNAEGIIAAAYDLQAGSYVREREDPRRAATLLPYARAIADVLRRYGATSVLEAGVGEATTFCDVVEFTGIEPPQAWGFDLCWSRIAVGREYARRRGLAEACLFTGSLFRIPVCDDAFDVVYTSHSIEPNRGRELAAAHELVRVARSHVVLFEPIYELAGPDAQARMDRLGYCRDLFAQLSGAGLKVVEYRLMDECPTNALNPTGVLVVAKSTAHRRPPQFICPQAGSPLRPLGGHWYSDESHLVYPVLEGVPCLLPGNGVLASSFPAFAA